MGRLCLYYRIPPEEDRWVPGDRWVRPVVRRMVRGKPRPGGVDKVFINLRLGLDRLGIAYSVNLPYSKLKSDDRVGVLGRGRHSLAGYDKPNPIVAGIGLMTHPSEWPTLCEDYPVVRYLQHSQWANDVYKPYFGDRCRVWPVGIDTDRWVPIPREKDIDFLLYDKVHWDRARQETELLDPLHQLLIERGLSVRKIRYGSYDEAQFRELLSRSRAMLFVTEHESQGLAYLEGLSCGVPVLAWDPGWLKDPEQLRRGASKVPACSVPYFDARCGRKFADLEEFEPVLDEFLASLRSGNLDPRAYVLERLTLERCAREFVEIVAGVY